MDIQWHGITQKNLPGYIMLALDEIHQTYGHIVQPKGKSLLKFGATEVLGTSFATIWARGGDETYLSDNLIDTISSSNAGDTQAVKVEGHTIDAAGDFTFVSQPATLNGQNKVVLATPMARSSRLFNNSGVDFAGQIFVYEDDTVVAGVPQTIAKIHAETLIGENGTLKAATTISKDDYWLITHVYGAVNEKTAASVDFRFEVREKGKVFRDKFLGTAKTDGPNVSLELSPPIIVPRSADFRIRGKATAGSVAASAWANGILCGNSH